MVSIVFKVVFSTLNQDFLCLHVSRPRFFELSEWGRFSSLSVVWFSVQFFFPSSCRILFKRPQGALLKAVFDRDPFSRTSDARGCISGLSVLEHT